MAQFALLNPKRNPRRKTRRKTTRRATTRKRATARRRPARRRPTRRRYARRNPRKLTLRSVQNDYLMPALAMGGGAIVVDTVYAMAPLPLNLKTGALGMVTRAAVAIGAGALAGAVMGRKLGTSVALGGLVTQFYSVAKPQVQAMFPNIPMGEFIDWGTDVNYAPPALPAPAPNDLGYVNPAQVVSPGKGMGMYLNEYSPPGYGGYGGY